MALNILDQLSNPLLQDLLAGHQNNSMPVPYDANNSVPTHDAEGKPIVTAEQALWNRREALLKAKHNLELKSFQVQNPKPVGGINKGQGYTLLGLGLLSNILDPKGQTNGALVQGAAQGMQAGINQQNQQNQQAVDQQRGLLNLQAQQTGEDAQMAGEQAIRAGGEADKAEARKAGFIDKIVSSARTSAQMESAIALAPKMGVDLSEDDKTKIRNAYATDQNFKKAQAVAAFKLKFPGMINETGKINPKGLTPELVAMLKQSYVDAMNGYGVESYTVPDIATGATQASNANEAAVALKVVQGQGIKDRAQTGKDRAAIYEKQVNNNIANANKLEPARYNLLVAQASKANRGPGSKSQKEGDHGRVLINQRITRRNTEMNRIAPYDRATGKRIVSQENADYYQELAIAQKADLQALGNISTPTQPPQSTQKSTVKETPEQRKVRLKKSIPFLK